MSHTYLAAAFEPSTEYLASGIHAAVVAGRDSSAMVSQLLTHRNFDGGFGDVLGGESSVLSTAVALDALSVAGVRDAGSVGYSVGFLLNEQLLGGGWSDGPNSPSVYVTALAMRGLWHFRNLFALVCRD